MAHRKLTGAKIIRCSYSRVVKIFIRARWKSMIHGDLRVLGFSAMSYGQISRLSTSSKGMHRHCAPILSRLSWHTMRESRCDQTELS
jgi:hypothetical protein